MTLLRCLWIEGANLHSNKTVNAFILHSAIAETNKHRPMSMVFRCVVLTSKDRPEHDHVGQHAYLTEALHTRPTIAKYLRSE